MGYRTGNGLGELRNAVGQVLTSNVSAYRPGMFPLSVSPVAPVVATPVVRSSQEGEECTVASGGLYAPATTARGKMKCNRQYVKQPDGSYRSEEFCWCQLASQWVLDIPDDAILDSSFK